MEYFAAIALSKGKWAIVDIDDFYILQNKSWHYMTVGYAATHRSRKLGKPKIIYMHREIMGNPLNKEIDHINNDKLDNRKINLRLVTHSHNMMNYKRNTLGSSKYKGVCWAKEENKWKAQIGFDKVNYHIGYFKSEEEAAKAYDKKAKELFGEFAYINFKGET